MKRAVTLALMSMVAIIALLTYQAIDGTHSFLASIGIIFAIYYLTVYGVVIHMKNHPEKYHIEE